MYIYIYIYIYCCEVCGYRRKKMVSMSPVQIVGKSVGISFDAKAFWEMHVSSPPDSSTQQWSKYLGRLGYAVFVRQLI